MLCVPCCGRSALVPAYIVQKGDFKVCMLCNIIVCNKIRPKKTYIINVVSEDVIRCVYVLLVKMLIVFYKSSNTLIAYRCTRFVHPVIRGLHCLVLCLPLLLLACVLVLKR